MPGFGTFYRIKIGDLRHTCELQNRSGETTDDRGRTNVQWSTVREIKCAIRQINSTDIERARQIAPEATHRIFTHAIGDVTSQMRIVFGSRVFYIGAIDDMENMGRFVSLIVAEDLS